MLLCMMFFDKENQTKRLKKNTPISHIFSKTRNPQFPIPFKFTQKQLKYPELVLKPTQFNRAELKA